MTVPRRKKTVNVYLMPVETEMLYRLAAHEARDGEDPSKLRSRVIGKLIHERWMSLSPAERRALEKVEVPA